MYAVRNVEYFLQSYPQLVPEDGAREIVARAWELAHDGLFSGRQTVEIFGDEGLARKFEQDFEGNETHLRIAQNVLTNGDQPPSSERWTIQAFCWLMVFYVVLKAGDIPQLEITAYAAMADVFPDIAPEERQAFLLGILKRNLASWRRILGKSDDAQINEILEKLSKWEEPDLSGFNPKPFSDQWQLANFRRPLTKD